MSNKHCGINQTFIIEAASSSGSTDTFSACTSISTNEIVSCTGNTEIVLGTDEITINGDLIPSDNSIGIGTTIKRFRELNTISGSSTVWATTTLDSSNINLGLDSSNNSRVITAESIILADDILRPNNY